MTVELLFIKSQYTINAQNVLDVNQCMHGHMWSWAVTTSKRCWGGCEWFDRLHLN